MKLEIKDPCNEDWNKMKIGLISRHCDLCEKNVMDFTKMNRAEIITYILSNPNEQTCGRMNRDQFDFHHEDIPILIETLKNQKGANTFLILALVCLSLSACAQTPQKNINTPPVIETTIGKVMATPPDSTQINDSTNVIKECFDKNTIKGKVMIEPTHQEKTQKTKIEEPVPEIGEVEPLMGDIEPEIEIDKEASDGKVLQFAEKMPEYKGGLDSLYKFLHRNIKSSKDKGQGNVYVRFVVEKDGTITRPNILKSLTNSKALDAEVLRVIKKMPKWIPARNNGQTVAVYMTIPITFRLK